jgi:hypothetical protein
MPFTVNNQKLSDPGRLVGQNPLFVQVFAKDAKNEEKGGPTTRMKTEKAVAEEDWLGVKEKWESE